MTTTTILRSRTAAHAGINMLCHLEQHIAGIYADVRQRLGPQAPARLFEVEGAHRNRSSRLEQRMREHLLVAVPTPSGLTTFSGLTSRLEEQHDTGEIFVLLRELERELLHAYEIYEDPPSEDGNDVCHAPWIETTVLADQQQTVVVIEEECIRPRTMRRTAISNGAHNPLTGLLGDSARGIASE